MDTKLHCATVKPVTVGLWCPVLGCAWQGANPLDLVEHLTGLHGVEGAAVFSLLARSVGERDEARRRHDWLPDRVRPGIVVGAGRSGAGVLVEGASGGEKPEA